MSRTYAEQHLDAQVFDPDAADETFVEFRDLVALWKSRRAGRRLPARADFDIEDFRAWLGWICLFDVIEGDVFDLQVRLWGTDIAIMLGFDMTRRRMAAANYAETDRLRGYIADDMAFWARIARTGTIGLTDGSLILDERRVMKYRDIFLPLSSDGERVDKIISATCVVD